MLEGPETEKQGTGAGSSSGRGKVSLRILRSVPLVLFVAWAVTGSGLPRLPWFPDTPAFEENVASASHRVVNPSGADPVYPPNLYPPLI